MRTSTCKSVRCRCQQVLFATARAGSRHARGFHQRPVSFPPSVPAAACAARWQSAQSPARRPLGPRRVSSGREERPRARRATASVFLCLPLTSRTPPGQCAPCQRPPCRPLRARWPGREAVCCAPQRVSRHGSAPVWKPPELGGLGAKQTTSERPQAHLGIGEDCLVVHACLPRFRWSIGCRCSGPGSSGGSARLGAAAAHSRWA
jgi:hypothetical protein